MGNKVRYSFLSTGDASKPPTVGLAGFDDDMEELLGTNLHCYLEHKLPIPPF